jgi:hypothetical protein
MGDYFITYNEFSLTRTGFQDDYALCYLYLSPSMEGFKVFRKNHELPKKQYWFHSKKESWTPYLEICNSKEHEMCKF